jgi:hypothetical protein
MPEGDRVGRISGLRRRGYAPRKAPQREGGPGRPNPSQPRVRLPPPGAPGQVRHERDNGTPAAEAAPRNREPIAVVIWHGLQHDLLLLGAQEE